MILIEGVVGTNHIARSLVPGVVVLGKQLPPQCVGRYGVVGDGLPVVIV